MNTGWSCSFALGTFSFSQLMPRHLVWQNRHFLQRSCKFIYTFVNTVILNPKMTINVVTLQQRTSVQSGRSENAVHIWVLASARKVQKCTRFLAHQASFTADEGKTIFRETERIAEHLSQSRVGTHSTASTFKWDAPCGRVVRRPSLSKCPV